MNETEKQATGVLLPSSRVMVYSKDRQTLEAAAELAQDWRFARVDIQTGSGDISAAIGAYKDTASPDLVIVQTDDISESLPRQLEDLAANCDEKTAAIVIGPVNDVSLYRRLIEMGVSDYLVRPVTSALLADVIAKTLIDRLGLSGSRLIVFAGAKGGVGTTVLAEAAAWAASDMLGQKTILLDVSGGWSSLAVGMGFEPSTTLLEAARAAVANDEDSLKRMLFKASERLSVLASGGDMMLESALVPDQMEKLIDMLMAKYPVVIADLSHAAPELAKTVIARASHIIVVTTPTLTALRQARSLAGEIKQIRGGSGEGIELVVNKQGLDKANEISKGDIEKAMELKVSKTIAFDSKTFLKAESESRKLTDEKTGLGIVQNTLLPILNNILSASPAETADSAKSGQGFMGGFLGRIKFKS